MIRSRDILPLLCALLGGLSGCYSGGGQGPTRLLGKGTPQECTAAMDLDAAAQLYRTGSGFVGHAGYQDFTSPAAFEAEETALYQADTLTLSSGLGVHLLLGPNFRDAAKAPGAPKDQNKNGTNLDEVYDAWMAKIAKASGATPLKGAWPTLVEYARGNPAYAREVDLLNRDIDLSSLRWDRAKMDKSLSSLVLGRALYLQVITAEGRLSRLQDQGRRHGLVPSEALRGLISLQAAWDKARFLLERLAYDGRKLGSVDPDTYDPAKGLVYIPDRIRITEGAPPAPGLPPAIESLEVVDDASTLSAQAELLRGALELYWISSPVNPLKAYRALFDGSPFPAADKKNSPNRIAGGLVRFLLADLEAMHYLPKPGTFVDLNLAGKPGRTLTVTSAAAVLRALAEFLDVTAGNEKVKKMVQAQGKFLLAHLLDPGTGLAFDGYDLDKGPLGGTDRLVSQLAMLEALLSCYQVLEDPVYLARALDLSTRMEKKFWVKDLKLLRTRADSNLITWTPSTTAWLAAGLRALRTAGLYPGAADLFAQVLLQAESTLHLLVSEDERTGEIVGDGNPDTDGDGIPETLKAGGPFGIAPVLADKRELLFTTPPPSGGKKTPTPTVTVTWSMDVHPIFINNCHCHLNGSKSGGLDLSSYESMMRGGGDQARFPIVVPYNASQSLLYLKLSLDTPPIGNRMPYFQDPLKPPQLKKVRDWINQGAREN